MLVLKSRHAANPDIQKLVECVSSERSTVEKHERAVFLSLCYFQNKQLRSNSCTITGVLCYKVSLKMLSCQVALMTHSRKLKCLNHSFIKIQLAKINFIFKRLIFPFCSLHLSLLDHRARDKHLKAKTCINYFTLSCIAL